MAWHLAYVAPWIVFLAWWIMRAPSAAETAERESFASYISHRALLFSGWLLFALDTTHPFGVLSRQLWGPSQALAVAGVIIEVIGIGFAIWARETLGRNWSASITFKQDHQLITDGPYRYARHPIYTGVLFAVVGLAQVRRDLASFVALALVTAGFARKMVIEERLMQQHFGAAYEAYRRRVKALIPFIL
jgi:protein-S-isoprenylcysteine O-methyltransferase Ste14